MSPLIEEDARWMRKLFAEPEFPPAARLKEKGNPLYKTGKVEPIDLIRDGGMLWSFALSNIIKYAFRLRPKAGFKANEDRILDLGKILHYAEILIADAERGLNEANGIPGK